MTMIIEAQGRVQWWLYTVSHGQLLFRRPKSTAHPRRFDILFKNVTEVHVFDHFDNLRVFEVEPGTGGVNTSAIGNRKVFQLAGDNAVGYIVAGTIVHVEDDLEYNEPSSLMP